MTISRRAVALGSLLLLGAMTAGCASTHMKRFIGRDVRYVPLEDGRPVNVFDLPDDQRAFQFLWGGGRYVVPATTTTQGQVQLVGDSAYYSERKLEIPAAVIDNPGCVITYIARWNAEKKGWIVVDIAYPHRLVC